MGLLAGLSAMGLGDLEDLDVFEGGNRGENKEKNEEREAARAKAEAAQKAESAMLLDKSYNCPVCSAAFTSKGVRSGRTRLIGTDPDLRARYEGIDMNKYDVVLCPECGYAALSRFFSNLAPAQASLIKEKICKTVKVPVHNDPIYTYPEAEERYKLALAGSVVKRAKASEKAYTCLKLGWLARSYKEYLQENGGGSSLQIAELEKQEEECMSNAYQGFIEARQSEECPICGMDEVTLDYLIAVLGVRFKKYEVSSRLVASVISSSTASPRLKDKARDLKDQILAELKKSKV